MGLSGWRRAGGKLGVPSKSYDIISALKAIALSPASSAAHRVAGALLDHFNRKTGQCDPSVERLAWLLEIDTKTVKTATSQLCALGLFKKSSHGGYGHRASYSPQWQEYNRLMDAWQAKMKSKTTRANGVKTPPSDDGENGAETPSSTGRKHPFKGGENAPQTYSSNQSNKPTRPSSPPNSVAENVVPMRSARPSYGLRRGREGQSPSHSQVAREQAAKRWNNDMMSRCGMAYGKFVDWVSPEAGDMATDAEMRRRGAGAALLCEQMHAAGMTVSDGR
jgi:hypothetical protein